ncbi:nitrate- and nitrite sensing domain-containing protein [Micromonospora sp. DPT]|uniref:sensor histidine kinase n=1 Tax=Micromonospora sp. DPT TaxID=3142975 RepID=UPI0032087711
MGSRSASLRTKVVALLVSLAALWAFAAWVTLRDGLNVLGVQTLDAQVAEPSESLLTELQRERRMSAAYLGRPSQEQAEQLREQRRRSEERAADFAESARSSRARLASSDELVERIDEVVTRLDALGAVRDAVATRSVDRAGAVDSYTGVLDSLFRVYASLGKLDDEQIAKDTATLTQLVRVRELMSQEDALFAGVAAAGRINDREYAQFAHLVGAQRFLAGEALAELPDADRERYVRMTEGQSFVRLRSMEDRLVRDGRPNAPLPVEADDWQAAIAPALQEQEATVLASGDALVDRATPVAIWVIVRMVLAAGLGLIAVIASVIVSITTARALVRQLERLREAAFRLANERLPGVVERLGHGEQVDVATEAPPLEFGDDEIGQVGKAFNVVQETAVRTAVEQAELRRNVREVFLSLARRTQALVHRQLTLLDAMERREQDAEELEDLFRVDHLATRMRRNAENLIVLSGSTPGRAWRRNVPMVDVVRGAVAEVEDYTRVNVLPLGPVSLAGRAVGDVIHLLAELIENGLSFSPPHTSVEVRGQLVANGFAVEIEDRGLGMTEDDLAAANDRIADRSELNLANAARLGLYVVSRLTERHGVKVQLKESAYGGTTAIVLIPLDLVETGQDANTSGGFPVGTGSAPPVAAGESAPPAGAPAADSDTAADGDPADTPALPVRAGTAPSPAASGLPTRSRTGPAQGALTGPTVPTGLPTTVARSAAPQRPATVPTPVDAAVPDPATDDRTPAGADDRTPAGADDRTPAGADDRTPAGTDDRTPAGADGRVTDSGLPVRVRQANIVPELRAEQAAADDEPDEQAARLPEQVRKMMSSYQTGTRRGRTDAARLLGGAATGARSGNGPENGDGQAT